jgi:hypothetical protein
VAAVVAAPTDGIAAAKDERHSVENSALAAIRFEALMKSMGAAPHPARPLDLVCWCRPAGSHHSANQTDHSAEAGRWHREEDANPQALHLARLHWVRLHLSTEQDWRVPRQPVAALSQTEAACPARPCHPLARSPVGRWRC